MLANQITERLDRLTPKERACLALVASRRSSKEIAAELGIAKTSVDTYCNRARAKLGVSDRYEAARLALGQTAPPATAKVAATAETPAPAAAALPIRRWSLRTVTVAAVGAALVLALALGALMSGLGALQEMRAPPSPALKAAGAGAPARVQTPS